MNHAPRKDRNGVELVVGMQVKFCVPVTKWQKEIFHGTTVIASDMVTERTDNGWLNCLGILCNDLVWIVPSSCIEVE